MAKVAGMGDNVYVGGFNLSSDTQQLSRVGGGPALIDVTDITQSGYARLGGERGGSIEWISYFDPTAGAAHPVLSALPTTDTLVTYARGTNLGDTAACCIGKEIDYAPTRGNDGSLTCGVAVQSNGFGLEWGVQLTAGLRTDGAATSPATGVDTLASASFGAQAYLQVTAFAGTSVAVKIQDSADNASFADISPSLLFTTVTVAPAFERIAILNTTTVRRYLRVITTGTFTNAVFSVVVVKNQNAGVVF